MSTPEPAPAPVLSPPEQILDQLFGSVRTRCIVAAAELELADRLADGPVSVEELASQTGLHTDSLFRMMRSLESIGYFRQVSPRVFENSELSEYLRKDVPGSQWAFVCMFIPGWGYWDGLAYMMDTLRNGRPGLFDAWGYDIWGHYQRNPHQATVFNQAMRSITAEMTPAVTAAYDWSRFPVIADIGGGVGSQLTDILNKNPECRGVLFDQPDVVAEAGKQDRMEIQGGSFFERIPVKADAYILRNIIHDWNDEKATEILRVLRKSTAPNSRVVLVEWLIPETSEFHPGKWTDMTMMTAVSGKERTQSEFAELFRSTGFELEETIPTGTMFTLIVGQPV